MSHLPSGEVLHLSIVLPLRHQDDLTSLLTKLYDPASPEYRKFLSVSEFTERFGPTEKDYDAVAAFARENGFTITGDPANRLVVPVSGTAEQVNAAFHVQMNVYQHPTESRTFFSPDREPSLALSVPVAHISGLDNFSVPKHFAEQKSAGQQPMVVNGSGPGGSYLGSDMRAAYYGGSTLTGQGQAVGILEFGGYLLSDVNLSFSNAGQSYSVPVNNVLLDGATGGVLGSDGEQVLDIVQAIGMAPGLSQARVYIGIGSDDALILNSMASENLAKQLSCSWGWRPVDPAAADPFFQEMAAQGQTFFTASGDSGAFDAAINPFFFPAEDAYVTTVGGTHLTTSGAAGSWVSETTWNSGGDGTGGGISPDGIAIPSWQVGLANSANAGSTTLRNVPDVAMEGDFDNYACQSGVCAGTWAGTSFAAPRWAGFMALVNQQAIEAGNAPKGGLGFLNPSLYLIAEGSNSSQNLHDIVSGTNDTENQPVWYSAVAGYDLTTGWGSPTGQTLIDSLAGSQVPGFFLATQKTVTVNPGGSNTATVTVTDAGGFTGNVTFALSALPSGVTAAFSPNPSTGTSVLTFTATSGAPNTSTQITLTGTAGNLSSTTTFTLAVHPPSFALTASPATLGITQGSSGTSLITVVPEFGFTDAVSLVASGLPSGVTATFSPATTTGSSTLTLAVSSTASVGTSTITISGGAGSVSATTTIALTVHGPSFSLATTGSVAMGQGTSSSTYVYVTDLYGFTGSVNLAASGLPSGVTATFVTNPTTGSSQLIFTASSAAAVGQSLVTITGTSGSLTESTTLQLSINAPTFTLYGPGSVNVGQGSSGTSYVYITGQYGFTGSVSLAVTGLPAGVTAVWSPNPTTSSSTLTLVASSSAAIGQYNLTITGTSGSQTATTTLLLGVYAPTFSLSAYGVTLGQGNSATSYVYVTPQYGFTGSVTLSIAGLPTGVTGTFSPNPTTGTSTLTLQATSTAVTGQYTATITGTSGSTTAKTTISIGVYTPTFTLGTYGSVNVGRGSSTTGYVYITSLYGFTGSVNLSVSGLPTGVTGTFSPNPTTGTSTLTLQASSSAVLGQYTATITGVSGTQTASTTITVGIYNPTFTVSGGGSVTVGQGTSTTSYFYVNPEYGFTGSVAFSVSGLPSGVTASFSPNPTTYSSTLTLTASSSAPLGQYNLTITGTSGSTTVTTSMQLGIYAPTFTLYGYGATVGQGSSASGYAYVTAQYGFSGAVSLSVAGLPAGVTATFSPNPTTYYSAVTFTASSAAAVGSTTVTVTGTSGTQTVTTTMVVTVVAPSFTLYSSIYSLSLNESSTANGAVYIQGQNGFAGSVNLSVTGLPAGVTASFAPNPTTYSSTLTLAANSTATPGTYTVTIAGLSGSASASTTFQLTVTSPAYTLTAAPSHTSAVQGGTAKSTLTVVPVYGFTGNVSLAVTGLPSGVTAAFSPASTASTSTLTLTVGATAAPGTSTVTVTGTSGSVNASVPVLLTIRGTPATTATALTVTPTSAASGTTVTATASVTGGSAILTAGQVNFCDASATVCDTAHLVGSAQLTSTGTATLHFVPGPGNRSLKAVFVGTFTDGPSTSSVANFSISGALPTVTTIAQSGVAGNYTLVSTVSGQGPFAPSGNVSFVDTTHANASAGSAPLVSGAATFSYSAAQSTTVGASPEYAVAGDFNGDGIPDLAVSYGSSSNVTILLGKGDGTFKTGATLAATQGPLVLAVGDFNHDGKADLAVVSVDYSTVTIFLGNGDGTFGTATQTAQTGSYPYGIAIGDFNGDGLQDLAIANEDSYTVSILLGNGDGTFLPSATVPTGYTPRAIAVGDFNGDGLQDLAVANTSGSTLSILLGNGDGTFTVGASPSTGSTPVSLAVADFNGDGKADIVVGTEYSTASTMLLGNGDGTFTTGAPVALGAYPLSLAVADFNGDGKLDVVASNYYTSTLTTVLGNGDGTFTSTTPVATGGSPYATVVADWNGDGIPDVASVNYSGSSLSIFTGARSQKSTATATGISPLGLGQDAVKASYPGDIVYAASASSTTNLTGTSVAASVTATVSGSAITTLQPLTVTVSVAGASGYVQPTGSVSLTSGSYSSSPVALSGGAAVITVPTGALPVGVNALQISYSPDATSTGLYNAASGYASVTVSKTDPALTLGVSSSSVTTAQPVVVTASVSSGAAGITPTGSVTLSSGSYSSAPMTLAAGNASITIPAGALSVGIDTLQVTYTPDAAAALIFTSAVQSTSVTVVSLGTNVASVSVTPANTTITNLQSDAVTVTVAGVSGQPAPGGTVTLSSGTYSAALPLTGGIASFTIPPGALVLGANTLTASYSGDASYAPRTGTAQVTVSSVLMVVSAITPSVITAGGSGTGTVTLTAGGNYAGTMNLVCGLISSPQGAQSLPTCRISTASLAIAAGGSSSATLTISTTAASRASLHQPAGPLDGRYEYAGTVFAAVLLLLLRTKRRNFAALLALLACLTFGASGCAGGSSSGGGSTGSGTPATTAGSYTFSVTATDANSPGITTSANVVITVQ